MSHVPSPRCEPPDGNGFQALVFDWDGTLVDSRSANFGAIRDALGEFGLALDQEWYWPRHAHSVPDLLVLWQAQFGPLPVDSETITDRFRDHIMASASSTVADRELVQIARAAAGRGQKLAVASNASRPVIAAGLEANGIESLFPVIATRFDVERGKPSPDVFVRAAELLGVDPGECLVYEDADDGVVGALAAGMTAYNVRSRVLWPRHRG